MKGEYMFDKIKYINNKLYAWCDIREDWARVVLCQQCNHQYVIPGIMMALCNDCQEECRKPKNSERIQSMYVQSNTKEQIQREEDRSKRSSKSDV